MLNRANSITGSISKAFVLDFWSTHNERETQSFCTDNSLFWWLSEVSDWVETSHFPQILRLDWGWREEGNKNGRWMGGNKLKGEKNREIILRRGKRKEWVRDWRNTCERLHWRRLRIARLMAKKRNGDGVWRSFVIYNGKEKKGKGKRKGKGKGKGSKMDKMKRTVIWVLRMHWGIEFTVQGTANECGGGIDGISERYLLE